MATLQELRDGISQLKELEVEISAARWQIDKSEDASSPRGVADSNALIQRYETARDLYLQRRMENLLVDHVTTYDATSDTFDMPQTEDGSDDELKERHAQVLATLQTSVEKVQSQVTQLRDSYEAVCSRREELEQMVLDLESEQDVGDDGEDEMDEDNVDTQDIEMEQERIEQLQQSKRRLQEELAQLQVESKQTEERVRQNDLKISELKLGPDGEVVDPQQLQDKLEELREMKLFYDSLREVMEELGGVKIVEVEEESSNRHLQLSLLLYDQFYVQVELQVYRQTFLKLVSAKWSSKPIVYAQTVSGEDNSPAKQLNEQDFHLTMAPLDDLVQVAKSTLTPPHDLRFLVRESLARIRIFQNRVDDLALLRRQVLTKVENGNRVVCSLNDGIVVVMGLYDMWVRVEQVVGVSGWDQEATDKIQAEIHADENTTPTLVIKQVQEEIERLKLTGVKPRTPRFPVRKGGF